MVDQAPPHPCLSTPHLGRASKAGPGLPGEVCSLGAVPLLFLSFFGLFRAAPMAYEGSQAKGPIGAVATATATATPDASCIFDLHHSSWQRWILNPLNKARDQTRNLMDTSRIP